ncbi:unnamed protein product [Caenorhabditis nigoni]
MEQSSWLLGVKRIKEPGFDDNDRSDSDARNLERTSVYSSAKRPSTVVRSGFLSKKLVKSLNKYSKKTPTPTTPSTPSTSSGY